jgi:hypothetical protein
MGASACKECDGLGVVPTPPAGKLAWPLPVEFLPRGDERLPDGVALVEIIGFYFLAPVGDGPGTTTAVRRGYSALGYERRLWLPEQD